MRGADDGVLLGLDGLHDVVHAAGAGGVERGEQHLVGVPALVAGAGGVGEVEDLVVEGGDRAAGGADVAAAGEAHRLVSGGEVEGAGDLGAPVDHEGGAVRVVLADAEPADVVVAAVAEDEPAEAEAALPRVERGEQPGLFGDQHVPFEPALVAAGAGGAQGAVDGGLGLVPQVVESCVEIGDESLFIPKFLG